MTEFSTSKDDDIVYPSAIPFLLIHVACVGAIWSGVTEKALILGGVLYALRMFAIGAAYHRYFAHRAFKTSRWFQFGLAVLAQTSAQKSVLWWAAKHRHHHLHADTKADVHSPAQHGFLYAHLGWIFSTQHQSADLSKLDDLTRFPELMWLHRHELVPAVAVGVSCFLMAGWPGVFVGFVWSTVVLFHATFCINSLAHTHGAKRYVTGDDSRNNWLLALLTFGEGWHNNHHAFQSSARQGFRWWEWDPTYYGLRLLASVGLVWDLKEPPRAVTRNEQRLGAKVIERVAAQLASSFPIDHIAATVRSDLGTKQRIEHFIASSLAAYRRGEDVLPMMPDRQELRRRAAVMFAKTPSLEDIVERARGMIVEAMTHSVEEALASFP